MNWFKHYANADKDSRLQRLKADYGFWGMGIYWTILERVVCYGEGCYPRNELMGLKQNRRDPGVIRAVLDRYDLFHTDEFGMVRCIKNVHQSATFVPESNQNVHECGTKVPTLCTDSDDRENAEDIENEEDSPEPLAHVHVTRKEENREEENRTATSDELRATSSHAAQDPSLVAGSSSLVTRGLSPVIDPIIHELRTNQSWREAVCINSGYSMLLMRHFDAAIDIFLRHVRAGADEVELTDRRRAMNYFRNFTKLSHPAGRALKEELERMDGHTGPSPQPLPREGVKCLANLFTPSLWGRSGWGLPPSKTHPVRTANVPTTEVGRCRRTLRRALRHKRSGTKPRTRGGKGIRGEKTLPLPLHKGGE